MSDNVPIVVEEAKKKFYRRRLVTTIIVFVLGFVIGAEIAVILPTAWKYLQTLGSRLVPFPRNPWNMSLSGAY